MSGPTMLESLDKYYDDNRMYDFKILSTLGLEDEDINEIKKLNNKYKVVGSHTKDVIFNDGTRESVLRIHEINKGINNIKIIKGRMPKKYNEIVIEDGIEYKTDYKIGDKIKVNLEDNDTSIKTNELEIVGIVVSPEYLTNSPASQSRGNTNLGSGQVAYFSYAINDLFDLDYYTEIYVHDESATRYLTSKKDYLKKIKEDKKQINKIKEIRQNERYTQLLDSANDKIRDKEEKAKSALDKAELQLKQYKDELDNGKRQLDDSKIKLNNGKKELTNAKKELDNSNVELQQGYLLLKKSKETLAQESRKLDNAKKEIDNKLKGSDSISTTYDKLAHFIKLYDSSSFSIADIIKIFVDEDTNIEQAIENNMVNIKTIALLNGINFDQMLNTYGISEDDLPDKVNVKLSELLGVTTVEQLKEMIFDDNFILLVKESLPKDLNNYDLIITNLDYFSNNKDDILALFSVIRDIENGYLICDENLKKINESEALLNESQKKYEEGLNKFNLGLREYRSKLNKYNAGINEYNSNLELYNKGIKELEDNKKSSKEALDLAKEEIKKIDKSIWFIQTRNDNNEYMTYLSSYNSLKKLSNLFPIIFFLVSIMISLLVMARMAIENRNEIGTLKALGFNNHEVKLKFIIYSFLATLIGGIIGSIIGYAFIPKAVFEVFRIIHIIPTTVYSTNVMPIFTGFLLSLLCIVGSTILTINNLVKEKTTSLLRPIAPPIGKKIYLEKISFIWDKISYSNKLTIRNIFRYKRRIFMSIFGIASCTMILLAGYGIKDSISYVVEKQYNEINHNDALVTLDGKLNEEELNELHKNEPLEFNIYARIEQVKIENKRISLVIPNDKNEFKKALTLIDVKTKKEVGVKDDSIIITKKLAKYFNKKVGDTITITESNNLSYKYTISSICENYIGDYAYMSRKTYKKDIGDYKINSQYLKFKDLDKENEVMSSIKSKNSHILNVILLSIAKEQANVLFKSLNIIVYLMVIFSGSLSFVVFYSLAYINISERQREIATLKVLGFYNKEVDGYIMREEFIITILGIIVGLIVGTIYTYMLIDSIEINAMQYIKDIHLDSYLKTFGFMIIFTIIVSFGVHYALKKINLIESLKSVE